MVHFVCCGLFSLPQQRLVNYTRGIVGDSMLRGIFMREVTELASMTWKVLDLNHLLTRGEKQVLGTGLTGCSEMY
jgi:hypothetical protein